MAEALLYLGIPWSQKSENKHNCIQQITFTTSSFLTRVLLSGVCWICYDDHADRLLLIIHFYELTLKVKASLLFLCSISILYSFQCLCAITFEFSYFEKLVLKYLKNFCLSSFKCPNRVKFSFLFLLGMPYESSIFVFVFFFFAFLLVQESIKPTSNDHILLTMNPTCDCKEW